MRFLKNPAKSGAFLLDPAQIYPIRNPVRNPADDILPVSSQNPKAKAKPKGKKIQIPVSFNAYVTGHARQIILINLHLR
jgi:hypothetical protein